MEDHRGTISGDPLFHEKARFSPAMHRISFMPRHILFSLVLLLANVCAILAQGNAPALYHAASGDPAGKCLYVIFTFSEQSCFSCLSEITAAWCPALERLKEPQKVGALLLFNSPRLEVAARMRERLEEAGCRMPFVVDTNGALSAALFQSDMAGQVVMADADGRVLVHRNVGEEDEFSSGLHFGGGPGALVAHLESLIIGCTPSSMAVKKEMDLPIVSALKTSASQMPRVLDSVMLQGADTVEMPYGFIYSPTDRRYGYLGGTTYLFYLHDSSGRLRSAVRLGKKFTPVVTVLRNGELFGVGGESDTILIAGKGDSVLVEDEVITLVRGDMSGHIVARHRINPISPLSFANDVAFGAKKIYMTMQRTATASHVQHRGIDFDIYLNELYDTSTYAAYIDTMKLIREYDTAMRLQRTYGSLPHALAAYGASRSHFWLEFERWVRELPDGSVAFLHCASPELLIYRDGLLRRTIDLRGEYYHRIDGTETDGKIPRYAGMIVGEDGWLYCQYTDPINRKFYLVAVDPGQEGRSRVAEIGWNDRLLRVDPEGRLHLVRRGRHLQLLVCAPMMQGG